MLLAILGGGCSQQRATPDQAAREEMLRLLMPERIEIIQPFTRIRSFDNDTVPDGIELLVRAVNHLGNPGLMLVGDVRVEIYGYVPASADHKGPQIDYWDIPLKTRSDQQQYWNQLTQMYEFSLRVNAAELPKAQKFVLQVTYGSPLGERLTDEFVLDYDEFGGPIRGLRAGRP